MHKILIVFAALFAVAHASNYGYQPSSYGGLAYQMQPAVSVNYAVPYGGSGYGSGYGYGYAPSYAPSYSPAYQQSYAPVVYEAPVKVNRASAAAAASAASGRSY